MRRSRGKQGLRKEWSAHWELNTTGAGECRADLGDMQWVSRASATAIIPHWGPQSPTTHFTFIPCTPPIHPPPTHLYKESEGFQRGNFCLNPFNCSSWLLGEEPKSKILIPASGIGPGVTCSKSTYNSSHLLALQTPRNSNCGVSSK